jgi:hypothetical protein
MSTVAAVKFGVAISHFEEMQEVTSQEANQRMLYDGHPDLSL